MLGLYEVVYKLALPDGQGGVTSDESTSPKDDYHSLPLHAEQAEDYELSPPGSPESSHSTPPFSPPPLSRSNSQPQGGRSKIENIPLSTRSPRRVIQPKHSATPLLQPKSPSSAITDSHNHSNGWPNYGLDHAPSAKLPPALHANFLTSCIGVATIILLWIPIPILHWLGWEHFRWPGSQGQSATGIWLDLQAVAWGGAIYVSLIYCPPSGLVPSPLLHHEYL